MVRLRLNRAPQQNPAGRLWASHATATRRPNAAAGVRITIRPKPTATARQPTRLRTSRSTAAGPTTRQWSGNRPAAGVRVAIQPKPADTNRSGWLWANCYIAAAERSARLWSNRRVATVQRSARLWSNFDIADAQWSVRLWANGYVATIQRSARLWSNVCVAAVQRSARLWANFYVATVEVASRVMGKLRHRNRRIASPAMVRCQHSRPMAKGAALPLVTGKPFLDQRNKSALAWNGTGEITSRSGGTIAFRVASPGPFAVTVVSDRAYRAVPNRDPKAFSKEDVLLYSRFQGPDVMVS